MDLRALLAASLAVALADPAAAQCRESLVPATTSSTSPSAGEDLDAARLDHGGGPADWLAISGPYHYDSSSGQWTGAVYLWTRPGPGTPWSQEPNLLPADLAASTLFGFTVCFGDGPLFVGRPELDGPHVDTGAVAVLERSGGTWAEVQQLTGSLSGPGWRFGRALAWADGVLYAAENGLVCAFERVAGSWQQVAGLQPVNLPGHPGFASYGLAADGGLVAVGAAAYGSVGAVFLFQRGPAGWAELARIDPPTAAPRQHFGDTVALAGGLLHVGARGDVDTGQPWEVHVYDVTSSPPQLLRTVGDPWPNGREGRVLAATADTLLVGEWLPEPVYSNGDIGTVHVFRPADASQPEVHRLVDGRFSSPPANSFGKAAAILGETLLISSSRFGVDTTVGRVNSYESPPIAEPFCFCEAGAPCGNEAHRSGCVGALGSTVNGILEEGGRLGACGSASAGLDDLVLDATSLTYYQTAVLFSGTAASAPLPFADGLRCVGGETLRLGSATVPNFEFQATFGPGLGALGGWQAGDTRFFQVWYRDPNGECGNGSNLTHALRVTFQP